MRQKPHACVQCLVGLRADPKALAKLLHLYGISSSQECSRLHLLELWRLEYENPSDPGGFSPKWFWGLICFLDLRPVAGYLRPGCG